MICGKAWRARRASALFDLPRLRQGRVGVDLLRPGGQPVAIRHIHHRDRAGQRVADVAALRGWRGRQPFADADIQLLAIRRDGQRGGIPPGRDEAEDMRLARAWRYPLPRRRCCPRWRRRAACRPGRRRRRRAWNRPDRWDRSEVLMVSSIRAGSLPITLTLFAPALATYRLPFDEKANSFGWLPTLKFRCTVERRGHPAG